MEIVESDGSGSEFRPGPGGNTEDEDEYDDLELEDDQPDTQLKPTKASKQKKGVMVRNQVRTLRDQLDVTIGVKRKASDVTAGAAPARQQQCVPLIVH